MPRKRPAKQSARARARNRGAIALAVALLVGVVINLKVFVWDVDTSIEKVREMALAGGSPAPAAAPAPVVEAGDPADDPGAWAEGEVARGDTLGRILRQRGVPTADADAILRALEPHTDLRLIRPGQRFRIHTREDGKVDTFELVLAADRKVSVARTADGFAAAAETKRTDVRLEAVGGTITSSLYGAVRRAGEDTRLVAVLVDLFAYDLDFYNDQHEGDTFRLLVEKEYLDGKLLRYQRVRAAEYSGRAGTFRAFFWQSPDGKVAGYFREKGEGVEKTFLKTPLKFARISSRFDRRRMHPILHRRTAHLGVDYAAPVGTPVWAAGPGRIVGRGPQGPAGNLVAIDHGNGYTTVYMHLSRFQNGQKVGQRVKQKTVIGYVGTTGRSTGPHLHFSIKKNGAFIDPMTVKLTPGPGIPRAYRPAFDAEVAGLTARLAAVSTQPRAPDAPEDDGTDEPDGPALPEAPE